MVPLAFRAPFVATTVMLASLTIYGYSLRRRTLEARLLEQVHQAEVQRKTGLDYQC
jgi:hypothetical protein